MTRKYSVYTYLALAAALFIVWNTHSISSSLRAWVAAFHAPLWKKLATVRPESNDSAVKTELALLHVENNQLRQLVKQELIFLEQLAALQQSEGLTEAAQRHHSVVQSAITNQLQGVPARVIYRSPAAWNSSLWLNVGEKDNQSLERTVVAINSPVLKEGAVVGVVDYVGQSQSRMRLLSDAGLTPAVRAARGSWRDCWLAQQAALLHRQIASRDNLLSESEKETILTLLSQLTRSLKATSECWLLAKGELHGGSQPLWRLPGQSLKGTGFNYDFVDEEGPARDLRTGVPSGQLSLEAAVPLLKLKDLLITTGYDGVFPAGLPVAEIVCLSPLGEGDYYYTLEAEPCAGSLTDIDSVYVLPPVGFNPKDQPPSLVW